MAWLDRIFRREAKQFPRDIAWKPRRVLPLDNDGVARIFSKQLWDDPVRAEALKKAGYYPDLASNIVETEEDRRWRAQSSILRAAERERNLAKELSARHGPVNLVSGLLFSYEQMCADADGSWLQDMVDYDVAEEWNTIVYAGDASTAVKTGLPLYPGGAFEAVEIVLVKLVRELRKRYGDNPDDAARQEIKAKIKQDAAGIRQIVEELARKPAN